MDGWACSGLLGACVAVVAATLGLPWGYGPEGLWLACILWSMSFLSLAAYATIFMVSQGRVSALLAALQCALIPVARHLGIASLRLPRAA